MQKFILTFFLAILASSFSYSQEKKFSSYQYGKNGIDYIITYESGNMIVVSTFNARVDLIDPVAKAMFYYYTQHKPKSGDLVSLQVDGAKVTGTCKVWESENLTSVEFHYETIMRDNGITELYKSPLLKSTFTQTATANED